MTRPGTSLLLLVALAGGPASAQTAAPDAKAPRIVERCHRQAAEEILVCGDPDAPKPYRLPPRAERFDPWGGTDSVSRERNKLLGPGPAGNGSCTVVGPGGWTGCDVAVIKQSEQQGKRVGIGAVGLQIGRKHYGVPVR